MGYPTIFVPGASSVGCSTPRLHLPRRPSPRLQRRTKAGARDSTTPHNKWIQPPRTWPWQLWGCWTCWGRWSFLWFAGGGETNYTGQPPKQMCLPFRILLPCRWALHLYPPQRSAWIYWLRLCTPTLQIYIRQQVSTRPTITTPAFIFLCCPRPFRLHPSNHPRLWPLSFSGHHSTPYHCPSQPCLPIFVSFGAKLLHFYLISLVHVVDLQLSHLLQCHCWLVCVLLPHLSYHLLFLLP